MILARKMGTKYSNQLFQTCVEGFPRLVIISYMLTTVHQCIANEFTQSQHLVKSMFGGAQLIAG